MTVLGGKQFLKLSEAVLKLLSRLLSFVFVFWFVFSRFSSTLTGRKGEADICRGTVPRLLARIVDVEKWKCPQSLTPGMVPTSKTRWGLKQANYFLHPI